MQSLLRRNKATFWANKALFFALRFYCWLSQLFAKHVVVVQIPIHNRRLKTNKLLID